MIKLTFCGSLDKVCEFIDNRLVLLMSEQKLRQTNPGVGLAVLFKDKYRIKNIDNTVLYIEKDSIKATAVISTSEKKGDKINIQHFGLTIRKKSTDELEMYIDTLAEAFKKGIIRNEAKRKVFTMKSVAVALIALMFIGIIIVTGGWFFVGICIFVLIISPIYFPIQYFLAKRKFKQIQDKMNKIVSIFESEYDAKDKLDTKDWINFWGQVKSNISETIKDVLLR